MLRASSKQVILHSTNYPRNYPDNLDYTWTITASEGQHVELVFEFIKLEEDYDFITITSGSSVTHLTGKKISIIIIIIATRVHYNIKKEATK